MTTPATELDFGTIWPEAVAMRAKLKIDKNIPGCFAIFMNLLESSCAARFPGVRASPLRQCEFCHLFPGVSRYTDFNPESRQRKACQDHQKRVDRMAESGIEMTEIIGHWE